MIVRSGGVTSTAKTIVSVATFPATSFATRVTSCPLSDRPARVCEVASRARSTGGAEGLATVLRMDGDGREAIVGLPSGIERVEGDQPGHGSFVLGVPDPEPSPILIPRRHVQGPCGIVRRAIE